MKRWEIRKLNSCAVKTLSSQFIATDNGRQKTFAEGFQIVLQLSDYCRLTPFSSSRHKNTIRSLKKLIFLSAARFHVSKCLSPYLFSNHIKHWELPRSLLSNLLHAENVEDVKKVLLRECERMRINFPPSRPQHDVIIKNNELRVRSNFPIVCDKRTTSCPSSVRFCGKR